MYGSFNCITFDHAVVHPIPLVRAGVFCLDSCEVESQPLQEFQCSIWGPTCDSIDCIGRDMQMPEMFIGDWVLFRNMGAYTVAAASAFNGFQKSPIVYTSTRQ